MLPREQPLPDGSYLTSIYALPGPQGPSATDEPARVIEYRLEDPALAETEEQRYRLITTILDPERRTRWQSSPRSTRSAGNSSRHSMS